MSAPDLYMLALAVNQARADAEEEANRARHCARSGRSVFAPLERAGKAAERYRAAYDALQEALRS